MPTAKRLPSGSWRCQVFSHKETVTDKDGNKKVKRIYKSFTSTNKTRKGKIEAETLANKYILSRQSSDALSQRNNITLREAFENYIDIKENILSPSTIRAYKSIAKNEFKLIMDKILTT